MTEPTARATAALLKVGGATPVELNAAIEHVRKAHLPDGGWPLEGTHATAGQTSQVGPSLPCVLALSQAQKLQPEPDVARVLQRAGNYFDAQLLQAEAGIGADSQAELLFTWCVRGRVLASDTAFGPERAAAVAGNLRRIVSRVTKNSFAQDDTQLQLLLNALHALSLLGVEAVRQLPGGPDAQLSSLIAWALLAEPRSRTRTRLLAGALLAGAEMTRALGEPVQLVEMSQPAGVGITSVVQQPEAGGDGAEGYFGTLWHGFWSRSPTDQVVVLGKVVTALAIGASAAFYTGMWFAPKWDEQTDRVVKRLSGDIEVLVKRKHTGEAVADAHIELLPVTKSVRAITDAQGKARIVWDMLQPDADSLRLELVVAPREVPSSSPAPPTRQSLGNTSTVKAVVVNVP